MGEIVEPINRFSTSDGLDRGLPSKQRATPGLVYRTAPRFPFFESVETKINQCIGIIVIDAKSHYKKD